MANDTIYPVGHIDVDSLRIIELEKTVTNRRLREAILGTDSGWLSNIDAQISEIRSKHKNGGNDAV